MIAAISKVGQHDFAGAGSPRHRIVWAGCAEIEPAQTAEGIAAPRSVVDALPHRLAELAVARDIDADILLAPYDLAHRGA